MHIYTVDVLIFGGGIAGLWSLARLQQAGYSALLLEPKTLGGTQTLASQGIIHGGMKYALNGRLTRAAHMIQTMPELWRACLAGHGDLDLSAVTVLSEHQYLWSTGHLTSNLAALFARHAVRSRVCAVPFNERPIPLQQAAFQGHVYRLNEPVIDIESLVNALIRLGNQAFLQIDTQRGVRFLSGTPPLVELHDPQAGYLHIQARRLLFTAGAGNAVLLKHLGRTVPEIQLRPLHMLMMRGHLPAFYAHCLGMGTHPRLTITAHPTINNESLWYLGGQLAETGITHTPEEHIIAGHQLLQELLPWCNFSHCRWASLHIARAEAKQSGGQRPDQPFLHTENGISIAWPTKLAFAPLLANVLLKNLREDGLFPTMNTNALTAISDWPIPRCAKRPWEDIQIWN